MSIAFDALGTIVFSVSPIALELSVVTGVGPGWVSPISSRAMCSGMASLHP